MRGGKGVQNRLQVGASGMSVFRVVGAYVVYGDELACWTLVGSMGCFVEYVTAERDLGWCGSRDCRILCSTYLPVLSLPRMTNASLDECLQ